VDAVAGGQLMYDGLTLRELAVLQSMLYEGTEEAFRMTSIHGSDPDWFSRYRPLHSEIGLLFIEAGTELLERMGSGHTEKAVA
jgi:hypothetical protein